MSEVIHRPNNDGLTPISYSNSKPNVRSLQAEVDELRRQDEIIQADYIQEIQSLKDKDDKIAAQLADTVKEVNGVKPTNGKVILPIPEVDTSNLATKSDVQQLSLTFKESYDTVSALNAKYPNGDNANHVVLADNMIYTYKNGWVNTGIQANGTGITKLGVTKEKYSIKSIGVNQIDFAQPGGKNLYNKDTAVRGYTIDQFSGNIQINENYYISDYIAVEPNTQYSRVRIEYATAFYDSQLKLLGASINERPFTTPANCHFIRVANYHTTIDAEQVEKGAARTTYEDYKINIPKFAVKKEVTADYDRYPFQPLATLKDESTRTILKKAIKRIELYGADSTKKYALGILQKNYSNIGTGIYIAECKEDGSFNRYVANTVLTSYSIPSGVTVFNVADVYNHGVSAKVWIDWGQIPDNAQYVTNTFDVGGLDIRTITQQSEEVLIKLPPKIYGLVGKEMNIYFDNIILADNLNGFNVDVTCTIGTHQNERWTCTPTKAETTPLTIALYKNGNVVASGTTSVIVKATSVGNGVNKKCLFIGDSTTEAAIYTQELLTLFGSSDVMDITLLGTRGTAPNLHEGRGGWKASGYTGSASLDGVANPFFNTNTNSFDFSNYMTKQGYSSVDVVGIHLGINDLFSYGDDASLNNEIVNVLSRFDTMINSVKAHSSKPKVAILVTIPPSRTQDAFGKNYANGQTQWRYKRNNFMFMKALIDKYSGQEENNIFLVPINVNLDTLNNMEKETVPVNSRNTTTVIRQSNGVHPANSGYYQMADMIYYWLKCQES